MKLTYTISAEDYLEALAFQLRLNQKTLVSRLRYWLGSWGIFVIALWFGVTHPEYQIFMRVFPAAMAALMLIVASLIRFRVDQRAARQLNQLIKNNTLNAGFLGTHLLSVRRDTILLEYGQQSGKIFCRQVVDLHRNERTSFLMAGNVIFDLIPNAVLDENGRREQLMETIRNNTAELQREQSDSQRAEIDAEDPNTFCSCPTDRERTARGLTAGYRMYYSTSTAWKGQQTLRAVVLIYAVTALFSDSTRIIGLLCLLIGIFLNYRLLTVFTPMALSAARQPLLREGNSALAEDYFYTTDQDIVSVSYGHEVRCKKKDILEKRESKEFLVFYTGNQQMVVIHKAAFTSEEQLTRFKNLL